MPQTLCPGDVSGHLRLQPTAPAAAPLETAGSLALQPGALPALHAAMRHVRSLRARGDLLPQRAHRTGRDGGVDGALRVQLQPDERVTGQQRWFVRVQCRPDTAAALADSMAARDDVSWLSITSGGSEIVCVAFSDPSREDSSVLARLPRTRQVLSFTAFAVLHMHVSSSEAKWMPFDEPLACANTRRPELSYGISAAQIMIISCPRGNALKYQCVLSSEFVLGTGELGWINASR